MSKIFIFIQPAILRGDGIDSFRHVFCLDVASEVKSENNSL